MEGFYICKMRDSKRIGPILENLERIWRANPDLRLGQLIVIATKPTKIHPEVFNIEDDKLEKGLLKYEKLLTEINDSNS